MSDHHKHTEFLRHCIRYDDGARCQVLMAGIIQLQHDARCVRRAVWFMAILAMLCVFGYGYGMILVDNFPYNFSPFMTDVFSVLTLSWVISLLTFLGLGLVYRWKLDRRREECRQIVTRLLASRLGEPAATTLRALQNDLSALGSDAAPALAAKKMLLQ